MTPLGSAGEAQEAERPFAPPSQALPEKRESLARLASSSNVTSRRRNRKFKVGPEEENKRSVDAVLARHWQDTVTRWAIEVEVGKKIDVGSCEDEKKKARRGGLNGRPPTNQPQRIRPTARPLNRFWVRRLDLPPNLPQAISMLHMVQHFERFGTAYLGGICDAQWVAPSERRSTSVQSVDDTSVVVEPVDGNITPTRSDGPVCRSRSSPTPGADQPPLLIPRLDLLLETKAGSQARPANSYNFSPQAVAADMMQQVASDKVDDSLFPAELRGLRYAQCVLWHEVMPGKPPMVVNLNNAKIGDAGAIVLGEALTMNRTVATLWLCGNQITKSGARAISNMLLYNTSIERLSLANNQAGSQGAEAIAESLTRNKKLTALNLSCNFVTDPGAVALGAALKVNTGLRYLFLASNEISDEGSKALAFGVRDSKLRVLQLSGNKVSKPGAEDMMEGLHYRGAHVAVELFFNPAMKDDRTIAKWHAAEEARRKNMPDVEREVTATLVEQGPPVFAGLQ